MRDLFAERVLGTLLRSYLTPSPRLLGPRLASPRLSSRSAPLPSSWYVNESHTPCIPYNIFQKCGTSSHKTDKLAQNIATPRKLHTMHLFSRVSQRVEWLKEVTMAHSLDSADTEQYIEAEDYTTRMVYTHSRTRLRSGYQQRARI